MSKFNKVDVKDKVVEHPQRIKLTNIENGQVLGTFDYEKIMGVISELGTAQNKTFLQPIQDGLYDIFGDVPNIPLTLKQDSPVQSTIETNFTGPIDSTIKGKTLVNLAKNIDELSKWTVVGGTAQIVGDVVRVTGDGSNAQIIISQDLSTYVANEKRFGYGRLRTTTTGASQIYGAVVAQGGFNYFVNENNPSDNDWFEGGVIVDSAFGGASFITYRAVFADAATANGKILEIDIDSGTFVIEDGDKTLNEYVSYTSNGYFDGMQHTRGVAVKSVNKNLASNISEWENGIIDSNGEDASSTNGIRTNSFIVVEGNNDYTYSVASGYIALVLAQYDENENFISRNVGSSNQLSITTNQKTKFIRLSASVIQIEDFGLLEPQLEQGSTATEYTPHESTETVYSDALGSVPNGIADEIDAKEGVKIARTNVLLNGEDYKLKASEIVSMVTTFSNVDLAVTNVGILSDSTPFSNSQLTNMRTGGKSQVVASERNNSDNIGAFSAVFSGGNRLDFIVQKGTTLQQAKDMLENEPIVYELETPQRIKLDQVGTTNSYTDYTQISAEVGVVKNELANVYQDSSAVSINLYEHPTAGSNPLKFKVKKFRDVKYDGRSIFELGEIRTTEAYGDERWLIFNNIAEANNIDINKIYVDYTTLETSPAFEVEITIDNTLEKVVENTSKSISNSSKQVDVLSNILSGSIGCLGGKTITEFSISDSYVASWLQPKDSVRVELYQATFDLKNLNYQQLNNMIGIEKYSTTDTSLQLITVPDTYYFVVPVVIYSVGGFEYRSLSNVSTFKTAVEIRIYNRGVEELPISKTPDGVTDITFESTYIRTSDDALGHGIKSDESINFSGHSLFRLVGSIEQSTGFREYTLRISTGIDGTGSVLLEEVFTQIDSQSEQVVSIDVSSISTGYFKITSSSVSQQAVGRIHVLNVV